MRPITVLVRTGALYSQYGMCLALMFNRVNFRMDRVAPSPMQAAPGG